MSDIMNGSTLDLRCRRNRLVDAAIPVCAAALLLLAGATTAEARQSGNYRFTTVLDNLRDGLVATRCAAINTLGTVAVQVDDVETGVNKMITKRGAHDLPVIVADTQQRADYPTFCDNGFTSITSNPSINEKGEVAFQGNLRRLTSRADCQVAPQPGGQRQGVFLGKGGPLTTIAHTKNQPGGNFISEFLVADVPVNSFGKVALVPELDNGDAGLFVGSKTGTFETRFLDSASTFDAPSSRPSLNEVGQIAFQDNGIVVSNPNGTFTTIVDSSGPEWDFVFDPSLNILGRAAFFGAKVIDDVQILGIFTGRGGPVTTVADSTGPYSSFSEPSLNDLGRVVFTADLDEFGPNGLQVQGVFTGPDPESDKVIKAGDLYEGLQVTSVFTCEEALNDLGQIVMIVQSENPETFDVRTFVVKATPKFLHGVD